MIRKTFPGLMASALACLAGCSNSDTESYAGDHTVKIQPIISRVSGLDFDTNDPIGLTITQNGTDYVRNKKMIYSGSYFEADDLFWYSDANGVSTLTAYYPYSAQGVPTEFSVETNQQSGSATSCLLVASKADVKPSATAVGMTFTRLCSSILVRIENQSGSPVNQVVAGGSVATALVDIFQKSIQVKPGVAAIDISAAPQTAGIAYEVVLIPQTVALTFKFELQNGKTWSKTLTPTLLEPGMQYTLSVIITAEQVNIALSGAIENWGNGGELGGDESGGGSGEGGGENEPENGILTYQGEQYRTVEIAGRVWMAENMRYIPNPALLGSGIWYPAKDGEECSDPAYIKTQGIFYDFATATGGTTVRAGTPVQGICPAGWQLPDDALLQTLISDKSYNYNTFASFVGFWNTTLGSYGTMTKSYLLGVGEPSDGKRNYLLFVQGALQPSAVAFTPANGVLVRCVQVK